MLDLIFAYAAAFGPFIAAGLVLGVGIPLLFLVAKPLRWIVAVAVLSLCLVPFGGGYISGASEGSMTRQIGWGSIFLIAAFLTLKQPDGTYRFDWRWVPIPFVALLLFAVLSVFWADQRVVSARRVVQLLGVLLIAFGLVRTRRDHDAFLQFSWPGLLFLLLGVLALAVPSMSFEPGGSYKGFTFTKNVWGQFALLMALIFLYKALNRRHPAIHWFLFILASISLAATRSATTILIYALAVSLMLSWVMARNHKREFAFFSVIGTMLLALVAFGYFVVAGELPINELFASGLDSVGKNTTLTGRTDLWRMMGYEIARHPWLGVGYGSFWLGLEGQSVSIVRFFSWQPGQAHNGYIDVVNELGFIGLGLLVIALLVHVRNIYRIFRQDDELVAVFHLAILVATLLLNISESALMRTTHLWWIILTLSIVEIHVRCATRSSVPGTQAKAPIAEPSQ